MIVEHIDQDLGKIERIISLLRKEYPEITIIVESVTLLPDSSVLMKISLTNEMYNVLKNNPDKWFNASEIVSEIAKNTTWTLINLKES